MNQVWLKSLSFHQKHLYPGQRGVDVQELCRALKCVEGSEKNAFASYCIRNKSDQKAQTDDIISIQDVQNRIQASYKDTKDTIYLDAFFNLIDNDNDGNISYKDLTDMKSQLGKEQIMNEKAFDQLTERLNHQTQQIGKQQFIDIIRQYI